MINISLAAEPITTVAGLPITNSMLGMLSAGLVLIWLARLSSKRAAAVPNKFQAAGELVVETLFNLVDGVTGDRDKSKKFFPLVATIFLFVLFMNWIGLIPLFGTIGLNETVAGHRAFVPFLRSGSADLNMTLAIALIAQLAAQVFGVMMSGGRAYGRKFFNLKNPLFTFVGLIEFISEFTKIISFSFRLFGNIFAGEVLLLVISTLVPLIAPVPFFLLEIFVGFIQALVFALLALVFFTIASTAAETAH